MKALLALLLVVALPAFAQAPDAPVKEETCADGPPDITGESVCLEQGEPAPFRLRGLSFGTHRGREKVNARNADFWDAVTAGDVVVVSKAAFYVLISGGTAAVIASIVLGALAATHKL